MRGWGGRLLPLLLSWIGLGLGAPLAQERVFTRQVDGRQLCSVQVTPYFGSGIGWGASFVRVEAVGVDSQPHRIEIEIGTQPWVPADVALHRVVLLQPGERSRVFLLLPTAATQQFDLRVTIDGNPEFGDLRGNRSGGGHAGLLVTDRSELLAGAIDVMQQLQRSTKVKPDVEVCAPGDLPDDWRMFTAFHVVLVDGRSNVPGPQQEALRRFVHAGGTVAIGGPELLPAGALRELGELALRDGVARHGLGRCVALDVRLAGEATAETIRLLPGPGGGIWPLPRELRDPVEIPGLGNVSVTVFLLVILAFAVVAGPVNFFYLRRRKQPMLALLTVPLLGFGTTAVMLLYGLLHDGFGVRGSIRSWSLLDQRRHEVAAVATEALFSGFTPGAFPVAADRLLLAPMAQQRDNQRSPHRWHFDGDTNSIDGGILPSRTVTPLLTGAQTACRQRLRVKTNTDGSLRAVSDDLRPRGELLLRDRDGTYWRGAGGVLQRCSERDAEARVRQLRWGAAAYEGIDLSDSSSTRVMLSFVRELGGKDGLPIGSYLGRFDAPPWLDGDGLRAEHLSGDHLVFGLLSPEDFLP